jgi:hypothetical protein
MRAYEASAATWPSQAAKFLEVGAKNTRIEYIGQAVSVEVDAADVYPY